MPPLIPGCHTVPRPRFRAVVSSLLLLVLLTAPLVAQTVRPPAARATRTIPLSRGTITLSGGLMVPMAHDVVTSFWTPGPSLSVAVYRTVNRLVSLGLGGEVALLAFDEKGFTQKFPGVTPHPLALGHLHFFVGWRFQMRSGGGITPTLGATIGASKLTKASHQERVLGVRTTYYDVPGRFRLTGGGTAGVEFPLGRAFAVSLEGRVLYLVNDPDASVLMTGRLGFRLSLE